MLERRRWAGHWDVWIRQASLLGKTQTSVRPYQKQNMPPNKKKVDSPEDRHLRLHTHSIHAYMCLHIQVHTQKYQ